jgi:hypothetical protein
VGLTPLMMRALGGPLSDSMEVSAVQFPSEDFDRIVDEVQPCLVVVDVTYLDEARVRPVLMERLASLGPVLAFVSETGTGWVDDLGSACSGPLEEIDGAALLALVRSPSLTVVAG